MEIVNVTDGERAVNLIGANRSPTSHPPKPDLKLNKMIKINEIEYCIYEIILKAYMWDHKIYLFLLMKYSWFILNQNLLADLHLLLNQSWMLLRKWSYELNFE